MDLQVAAGAVCYRASLHGVLCPVGSLVLR